MNSFWIKYGDKIISIAKGAAIAGSGVAITYALDAAASIDFGEWTPVAVGVFSVIANIARKFGIPVITAALAIRK